MWWRRGDLEVQAVAGFRAVPALEALMQASMASGYSAPARNAGLEVVETRGFEPLTSTLPV